MAPPIKPTKAKLPSLHGRLMVDTINGRVRVRAWPRKRGPDVPEQVRIQNERFTEAQRMAKALKGSVMNKFIDATKKSGLYPRDLATKMMLAPPIELELPDGRVIRHGRPTLETELFQGFILALSANQNLPGTAADRFTWPVPILDTAGFFSAAAPDRVTIPPGVKVMTFYAGARRSATSTAIYASVIRRLAPSDLVAAGSGGHGVFNPSVTSGPIIVNEGEEWTFNLNSGTASTWLAAGTFFAGQIIAAEV